MRKIARGNGKRKKELQNRKWKIYLSSLNKLFPAIWMFLLHRRELAMVY